jgi:hypothetical protein
LPFPKNSRFKHGATTCNDDIPRSSPGFLSQGVLVLQELRDFLPELSRDLILRHVGAQQAELGVFIFLDRKQGTGLALT